VQHVPGHLLTLALASLVLSACPAHSCSKQLHHRPILVDNRTRLVSVSKLMEDVGTDTTTAVALSLEPGGVVLA